MEFKVGGARERHRRVYRVAKPTSLGLAEHWMKALPFPVLCTTKPLEPAL